MADITREDLMDYVMGEASDEVAQKIWEQRQQTGSFADTWLKNLASAAGDPFDISMTRLVNVEIEKDFDTTSEAEDDEPLYLKITISICITFCAILGISVGWFNNWWTGLITGVVAYIICSIFIGTIGGMLEIRKKTPTKNDIIGLGLIIGAQLTVVLGLVMGWYFGWDAGLITALISAIICFFVPSIIADGLLGKTYISASDALLVRQPQVGGFRGILLRFASVQIVMITQIIDSFLRERGDFQRGIKVAKISCITASQVDDWPLTEAMLNLGRLYCLAGEFSLAQRQLERTLEIGTHYDKRPSNYESVIGECKYLLGFTYDQMNENDRALQYLEAGLHSQKTAQFQNDIGIANNLNSLGVALSRTGEHDRAIEQYLDAVNRSRRELGNTHLLTGIILTNLSKSYEEMENGNQEKSIAIKEVGYEILRKHLPADHGVFTLRNQETLIPVKTRQQMTTKWEPVSVAM